MRELAERIAAFVRARDWHTYHTPKNLALAICSEAGELAHLYRWTDAPPKDRVADELADILIFALSLCNRLDLDPVEIATAKLDRNEGRRVSGPELGPS